MYSRWSSGRLFRRNSPLLVVMAPLLFAWALPAAAQPVTPPNPEAAAPAPSESTAVAGGLTAREAGRRAAETSVEAKVRQQQVIAARATRERVYWEAAPRLTFTAQTVRLSEVNAAFEIPGGGEIAVPQPVTNHSVNARLTVPLSDYLLRTVRALRAANANRAAAELQEKAARVTAASNAKLLYYDWVRARLESVLADQALETARVQESRVRALFDVGRAARADLLQAQAFEADAVLAQSEAGTREAIAEERLRVAIHAPVAERFEVGEDVLTPFPGALESASLEDLFREAAAQRLELQALSKSEQAAQNVSAVEGSRALPRLEGFGNVTYANPNPRIFPQEDEWNATWEAGLVLTWSVNDLGTASTTATELESRAAELRGQYTQVLEALRVEVVSALGALRQAAVNVTTAEQGQRAAAAAFAARERLQEQGMATTLELMQAETARIRARLNVINAHITLRVARVQLDHALGRDVAQP